MFWHTVRKAVPTALSALLVSGLVATFPIAADPALNEVSRQGLPTSWTPFDVKVRSVGVLDFHIPEGSAHEESLEGLFFRARRFRYSHDFDGDRWQSAEETERKFSGDCEDKAVWLFTKLKEAGYPNVRLVVGKYRMHDASFHVWVTYASPAGVVYLLDAAIQNRIWEISAASSDFYHPFFSFDGRNRYRHFGLSQSNS